MLFTSTVFILFFLPTLLILYFVTPPKLLPLRNFILLCFSLLFYAWGGVRYFVLLIISIIINYVGGIFVSEKWNSVTRKFSLVLTLILNLGLLGIFKYAGFAAETIAALGIPISIPQITLPIGISFFTFQGLSYVVDVYRNDAATQRNPLNVALYVSLFPQLVAGPIVRFTDVEKELSTRSHTLNNFSSGAVRFMLGFGKKMIMANSMGEIADQVFSHGTNDLLTTPVAWIGAIAYTFQIYFDFSAYSDMAIGLGRIFGFKFNENFNYPYISKSITEFWRRWHISLSTWFRDYVYIPLGGNRCKVSRHIFNIAVVWMLTGLWHGAAWTFVLWGVYYGALLILEKYVFSHIIQKVPAVFRHILTMLIVIIGWVFFRAEDFGVAANYIAVMFGAGSGDMTESIYLLRQFWPEFVLCIIGIFPIKMALKNRLAAHQNNKYIYATKEILPKLFALLVFGYSYIKLIAGSFNPFIYFQF